MSELFLMYQERPNVVQAAQFSRDHKEAIRIRDWTKGELHEEGLYIQISIGRILVKYGEWIKKDRFGVLTVCGNEEFQNSYKNIVRN